MQAMAWWQQAVLALVVVLVLWWTLPGVKAALERSRRAERKDWRGVLLPVGLVVVFVLLLIALVRGG
jgi:predicted MFS family arabinose efflux permease